MTAAVIWSEDYLAYRWTRGHPMNPLRLSLTMALARSLGVIDEALLEPPIDIDDEVLTTVHGRDYIDVVRAVGSGTAALSGPMLERMYGLGGTDNPIFDGMHEAARLLVGGTLAAAQLVHSGAVRRAVNIGGGMHHAMRGRAAGFCIYNDCAAAISWLLDAGYERIAYIDIDAHHGDGVQELFAADPRVLTVSLHQHPATLWPGTGWPTEVGIGHGEGSAVNLALMPNVPDRLWLRGFHAVIPSVLAEFRPQILISQCGVDSHRDDPLTDLSLTVDGQRAAMLAMRDLADKYCEGRWIAVGGGGYGLVDAVPRSWAHLIAVASEQEVSTDTVIDQTWRQAAAEVAASLPPEYAGHPSATMGDGGDVDYLAWDGDTGQAAPEGIDDVANQQTNRAILATRRAVYPLHGLDPEDPRD